MPMPSFMPSKIPMPMPSFIPSAMLITEFYTEFFEIKVLLLLQLPDTINRNSIETENSQTDNKQHTHTHSMMTITTNQTNDNAK